MTLKMESLGVLAHIAANTETAGFVIVKYADHAESAMPFEHRAGRYDLAVERAAMSAPPIFGEGWA